MLFLYPDSWKASLRCKDMQRTCWHCIYIYMKKSMKDKSFIFFSTGKLRTPLLGWTECNPFLILILMNVRAFSVDSGLFHRTLPVFDNPPSFSPLFHCFSLRIKRKNQVTHSAAQVCLGICMFASTSPNIFVYLPALSIVANDKTLTGPTSRSQLSPDVSVKEAPGGALKFYYVFTSAPRRGGGGGH